MKRLISRRLVIISSVLLLHVSVLWVMQSGLLRRAAAPVVPITVVSELLPQAGQRPDPYEPRPPAQPSAPVPRKPTQAEPTRNLAVAAAETAPAATSTVIQPQIVPAAVAAAPTAPTAPTAVPAVAAVTPPGASGPTPAHKVELPSSDAGYLNNPAPAYPAISRRLGEEGRVVVRVLIGPDGVAQQAKISSSSGYERLDQTALTTALKWRYVPGKRGGVPEAMWYDIPMNFRLSGLE